MNVLSGIMRILPFIMLDVLRMSVRVLLVRIKRLVRTVDVSLHCPSKMAESGSRVEISTPVSLSTAGGRQSGSRVSPYV